MYSFPPILPENAKILILGTMPGVKSLEKQEYYGHRQNHFWKIMFQLFSDGTIPEAYAARKQLLVDNGIAVWDVLESCQREGSLDSAIRMGVANDIPQLLEKNPGISRIGFNGKESFRLYVKHFGTPTLPFIQLPSTSPAFTLGLEKKMEVWRGILGIDEI